MDGFIISMSYLLLDASLAQLVEQLIRNEQVAGSSPAKGSKKKQNPLEQKLSEGFAFTD